MKFQYFSDIHLEFFKSTSPNIELNIIPHAPNLILAGDIGWYHLPMYNTFIKLMSEKFNKVWIVSGNHEYYTKITYTDELKQIHKPEQKTIEQIDEEIKKIIGQYPNVYYLSNDIVLINDTLAIFGCTLWTKIHDKDKYAIIKGIGDYKYIHDFSIEKSNQLHEESIEKLEEFLNKYPEKKFIVISHHLPTFDLIHSKYAGSSVTGAFASNVSIANSPQIIKWICGHTHKPMDVGKFSTNPIGYIGENYSVDYNKVFEIDDLPKF